MFFKFHSVSISTPIQIIVCHVVNTLNSTLFLYLPSNIRIITASIMYFKFHSVSISTLYSRRTMPVCVSFKFHSVSISTLPFFISPFFSHFFKFHSVSISTLHGNLNIDCSSPFKFHSVSISTPQRPQQAERLKSLNSTLFLYLPFSV